MENNFYSLQDFLLYTKGAAYYLMGVDAPGHTRLLALHDRQGRGERH